MIKKTHAPGRGHPSSSSSSPSPSWRSCISANEDHLGSNICHCHFNSSICCVRAHTLLWSRHRYFSFSTACKEAGRKHMYRRQKSRVLQLELECSMKISLNSLFKHDNDVTTASPRTKHKYTSPDVSRYFQFKVWCEVAADRIGSNRWKLKKTSKFIKKKLCPAGLTKRLLHNGPFVSCCSFKIVWIADRRRWKH